MTATQWIAIGAGGALGAMSRYGVSMLFTHAPERGELPWATLLVNVVGTLLLGVLAALALSGRGATQTLNLFLGTGLCGAMTTFSTFSVEAVSLARAGYPWTAAGYVALSLTACFVAVALAFAAIGTTPR